MQACKDLCLVVLRTNVAIQNLDVSNTEHRFVCPQLQSVVRLNIDLVKATANFDRIEFDSPTNLKACTQLVKSSAALLASLVVKLNMLEGTSAACPEINILNQGGPVHLKFTALWNLLHATCSVLHRVHPSTGLCQSVRTALDCLVRFQLCVTRSRSGLWEFLLKREGVERVYQQEKLVLSVLVRHVFSIGDSPGSDVLQDLAALPSDFLTLLSLRVLEQYHTLPTALASVQAANHLTPIDSTFSGLLILSLGAAMNQLIRNVLCNNHHDPLLPAFTTPAVIHMLKRVMIIKADQKELQEEDHKATLCILHFLLESTTQCNKRAVMHPSMGSFLHTCEGSGGSLLPLYRPSVPVSDLQMLHMLMKDMPADECCDEQRYDLVVSILSGWLVTTALDRYMPFPSPSLHHQLLGTYMATHHCTVQTVAWMRHQQHLKAQQSAQNGRILLLPGCCADGNHILAEDVKLIVAIVYTKPSMTGRLGELDAAYDWLNTDINPVLSASWDPTLVAFRHFHRMPGSVVMLESCVRDVQSPQTPHEASKVMHWMLANLLITCKSDCAGALPACISLASTVRKLIWISVQPRDGDTCHKADTKEVQLQAEVFLCKLMKRCTEAIRTLKRLKLAMCTPELPVTPKNELHKISGIKSAVTFPTLRRSDLHQLQTIMLVSWTQIFRFSVFGCKEGWSQQTSQTLIDTALNQIGSLGDGLNEVVRRVLTGAEMECLGADACKKSVVVDLTWEQYALTHFHGRLLPGCCYLGCSNLKGVSEAALPTQLCSGCRRVRYCSVECQRAAWVKGGHKNICV